MLHKIRTRLQDEKGFTLIELLVVILIIGILAAIALPTFLDQQKKGQDASAKSDIRNAISQVESCFTEAQTYVGCDENNTSLDIATGVDVTPNAKVGYTITKASASGTTFTVTKSATGISAIAPQAATT